jgi:hypothetical protein
MQETSLFAFQILRLLQALQCFDHEVLQLYDSPAALSLGIVECPFNARNLYRPANARCPALPVNIRPLESQVFAWTHSRRQGQSQNREPLRFLGYVKKPAALLDAQSLHLLALHSWQIDTDTRIFCKHLPAYCLAEADSRTALVYSIVRAENPRSNI